MLPILLGSPFLTPTCYRSHSHSATLDRWFQVQASVVPSKIGLKGKHVRLRWITAAEEDWRPEAEGNCQVPSETDSPWPDRGI